MKTLLFGACAAVLTAASVVAQVEKSEPPPSAPAVTNEPLRAELLAMAAEDQRVRQTPWPQMTSGMMAEVQQVDARNRERMAAIIAQYGWPGKSLVGADGASRAWLLVQHCDQAFQEKCLPLLERAVAAGEATGKNYAYLLDRVLMHQGKPQVYGTQFRTVEGRTTAHVINDPEHLDERRRSVGLGPWADYDRQMRQRDTAAEASVKDPALRQELFRLAAEAARVQRGSPAERTDAQRQEINLFVADTFNRLREILTQHGWPGASLVGADAGHEFFRLVTMQSNTVFWSECLPLLEKTWRDGQAPAVDFATLTDALRTAQGKLQLYGTLSATKNGQLERSPVEEPEKMNERRQAIGLEPLKP